jgi:2-dehydro-3-deoxygluconokinase
LTPGDIPTGLIESSSLLHVTGITAAISPTAREAVHSAIATARAAGVQVSFDLNYRSALWSRGEARVEFERLIRGADIVFGGDDELAIVAADAAGPEELARRIADLGAGQVIVKLGADGCAALVDGVFAQRAAVPVTPVDTVGAGDAFVAGYLAEYLAGTSLDGRLETAVTAGAFACLVPGDWEGMPRRSELGMLAAADPVHR